MRPVDKVAIITGGGVAAGARSPPSSSRRRAPRSSSRSSARRPARRRSRWFAPPVARRRSCGPTSRRGPTLERWSITPSQHTAAWTASTTMPGSCPKAASLGGRYRCRDLGLGHGQRQRSRRLLGCKPAIPAMIEGGGGSIINIVELQSRSSAAASRAGCLHGSKGAVLSLTRSLAVHPTRRASDERHLPRTRGDPVADGLVGTRTRRRSSLPGPQPDRAASVSPRRSS